MPEVNGRLTCCVCGADLGDAEDQYRDPSCIACERRAAIAEAEAEDAAGYDDDPAGLMDADTPAEKAEDARGWEEPIMFNPDAWRDNERERARVQAVFERVDAGDDLDDLEDDELEVVARWASGNRRSEFLAKKAQNLLDNRAEFAGMRQFESDMEGGFDCYTGDRRLRDSMAEARSLK